MRSRSLYHLWPPLAYLALAVLMTWPLAAGLAVTLPSLGDAQLQAWILAWDAHALATGPAGVWDAPIFYPYAESLATHDSLLPLAALTAPITLAAGPALSYNLLTLLSFALSGWAVFLLADDMLADLGYAAGPRRWAAFVGGAAFAFCAYRMAHLTQLNLLQTYWLPLALFFLRRLLRPPAQGGGRLADALLCGLCAGMQAATALYYAFFAAAALGGYAALFALVALWRRARHGEDLPWVRFGLTLLAGVVAGLVALPFALPYARVYAALAIVRSPRELDGWSAPLRAYLAVPEQNRFYGQLGEAFVGAPELALFPGLMAGVMALLAAGKLLNAARANFSQTFQAGSPLALDALFWPLLALGAFVLSLGTGLRLSRGDAPLPIPLPYLSLWGRLPGFDALRVPARWGWLVSLAVAVAAALALAALLARLRPRVRAAAGTLTLSVALAEQALLPLALPSPAALVAPPLYTWLAEPAQADIQVVLELPAAPNARGADLQRIIARQWHGQAHWKQLPVAYSGAIPFGVSDILRRAESLPAEETLDFLRLIGVDTLVIHADELDAETQARLLDGLAASPLAYPRGVIGASHVFGLRPDPRWEQLLAASGAEATALISADERIPGLAALALARRLETAGVSLYGPARPRYYIALGALPAGMVPAAALLSDAEDPRESGYSPADLIWRAHGLALYQRPPTLLASLALGRPDRGQFHPRHPAALDLEATAGGLRVNGERIGLPEGAGALAVELDVARLRPGTLRANEAKLALPAGLSTATLALAPGERLAIGADDGAMALLRLRVRAAAGPLEPSVMPSDGIVAAAEASFDGAALSLRASAAGAEALLLDVWGAAAADDRPIHLLSGVRPLPADGEIVFEVDLLQPVADWLAQSEPPQDGRYQIYLKDPARPGSPGRPVAKFNIRGGQVTDAEPVPLPLTAVP